MKSQNHFSMYVCTILHEEPSPSSSMYGCSPALLLGWIYILDEELSPSPWMDGWMDAHSSRTAEPSLQLSVDDVCTLVMKQTAS
jgi:hypothetical protein